jgi:hypothetical protein
VFLSDYKNVDGRLLPGVMTVRYGNDPYATFTLKKFDLAAK